MANNFDADILYDYLVQGDSQQDIADHYGIKQGEVSKMVKKYGLNRGNAKYGNGAENQRGRYQNLSYDDICAYMDSGSDDLDSWLNGDSAGYDDYNDGYDDYNDGYDDGYNDYNDGDIDNDNGYNNNYGNVNYQNNVPPQPQYGKNGKTVHYVNVENSKRSFISTDGRIVLLILGIVILAVGWLINKAESSMGSFGAYLRFLWDSDYLWFGIVTGGIFGFIKYQSCKSLGEVFTTCGTWTWAGVGYVIGAVVFFFNYGMLIPAVILALLGVALFFIGYKLFY